MPPKPKIKISVGEIVPDLRSGMTDSELMEKYKLSSRGLQSAFRKLLAGRFLVQEELDSRVQPYEDTADIRDMRLTPRETPDVPVAVCERDNRSNCGIVRNFTTRGVGIRGLKCEVSQLKRLVVLGDDYGAVEPFEFEAQCRWVKGEGRDCVAGFEILKISEEGLQELRKLMRMPSIPVVDSGEWISLSELRP